nr:MAG TPA: hypothetical protein [Caudoviricetes sp.]
MPDAVTDKECVSDKAWQGQNPINNHTGGTRI